LSCSAQHRFAFASNGQAIASEAFGQALAAMGVNADTPATVLCDGDARLWRLQREALPGATVVLESRSRPRSWRAQSTRSWPSV